MLESQTRSSALTPHLLTALLLCKQDPSAEDRKLTRVLDFLGITWKAVTLYEIADDSPADVATSEFCVLAAAPCLAEAIPSIEDASGALPRWMMEASSVYVYGFQDTDACRRLLRLLTRDAQGDVRKVHTTPACMSITRDFPEMCGPMSGLRVPVDLEGDLVFDVAPLGEEFQSIITANDSEVFFGVRCRGVQFYLNACRRIVDINSPSAQNLDVKKVFCEAVPAILYLKWAFRDICWRAPETSGCLIVDDPLLKPRYGFLDFRETLELMDRHNFTTTIGFIPWNWQRTHPRTVAMFQRRPDRFSLSFHGCDHTPAEFARQSTGLLNRKIKAASRMMESLLQRTSLPCDRVMVFPQGAFSPQIGRTLKLNGFVAAVNTEVAPLDNVVNETTIADLWDLAIMKYGTFPIFTRRYLTDGIENFAFDALLGKPCLIVAHHEVFKNHGRDLVDFIAQLNSLHWNLRWRSLGDAITHSCKVRNQADGTNVIQMFAKNLLMENHYPEPREAVLLKKEGDLDCVKAVMLNQTPVDFSYAGGYLQFRVTLYPEEVTEVRVIYLDKLDVAPNNDGIGYTIKTHAKRYLSEFRVNWLSQSGFLFQNAARIRQLLKWPPYSESNEKDPSRSLS
jgi:hypothetical protein